MLGLIEEKTGDCRVVGEGDLVQQLGSDRGWQDRKQVYMGVSRRQVHHGSFREQLKRLGV
jgi:hypothetical protein